MATTHSLRMACTAGIATLALASCGQPPVEFDLLAGDCETVFGGEVCTSGMRTGSQITSFTATVPMATIQNAPLEGEMVFPPVLDAVIALPTEVSAATGFSHLAVYWERHGHPPALFMTPHFDFHFYTRAPDEIAAIDCSDQRKPETLVAGYALPDVEIPELGTLVGLCVPAMGMHSMPSAELDVTDPFSATMIVGYYGGDPILVEPMIARAKLLEARTFEMPMPPAPAGLPANVRWPTRCEIIYDAERQEYRVVLTLPTA